MDIRYRSKNLTELRLVVAASEGNRSGSGFPLPLENYPAFNGGNLPACLSLRQEAGRISSLPRTLPQRVAEAVPTLRRHVVSPRPHMAFPSPTGGRAPVIPETGYLGQAWRRQGSVLWGGNRPGVRVRLGMKNQAT